MASVLGVKSHTRPYPLSAPLLHRTHLSHQEKVMHILTRAEEEYLFKTLKANALKECDPIVKGALWIRQVKNRS